MLKDRAISRTSVGKVRVATLFPMRVKAKIYPIDRPVTLPRAYLSRHLGSEPLTEIIHAKPMTGSTFPARDSRGCFITFIVPGNDLNQSQEL